MSFFPPIEPGERRWPRRPTLRAPEEVAADQALMKRFVRARRVQTAASIYVKILLAVAMGCFMLTLFTAVACLQGWGWSGPVCLLAGLCTYRKHLDSEATLARDGRSVRDMGTLLSS